MLPATGSTITAAISLPSRSKARATPSMSLKSNARV